MNAKDLRANACALCEEEDFAPIEVVKAYTDGQLFHVCRRCGLVQVPERRSPEAIAAAWSDEVFAEDYTAHTYTARIPHVRARQVFVAATLDDVLGLEGKTLCDIGAGEGQFLDIVRNPEFGAKVFGIEPSTGNCGLMGDLGIDCFEGAIEDWHQAAAQKDKRFGIATIMWTLEASSDPRGMLKAAWDLLEDGGHVAVAMGSRILVPFKKPLQYFMGSGEPVDQHPFHFSHSTLEGLLAATGFREVFVNRYIDNDVLCLIAQKQPEGSDIPWRGDDHKQVLDFFDRWHAESQRYDVSA